MYNPNPPAPPKKGMSTGLKVVLVVVLVVAVGFVGLLVLGIGGYVYYTRSGGARTVAGGVPETKSGLTGAASADDAEEPEPTAAQAAAVAGGQSAEWEQQEIAWTVPQRWSKHSASSTSFLWRSPGTWDAASLNGNVSVMSADFPTEIALNAAYQQAQQRKASGEVNEVRWLKIDGVKGVMFREAAPEDSDGPQRLQWIAYRDYKGQ
jgi:hypothetical protein